MGVLESINDRLKSAAKRWLFGSGAMQDEANKDAQDLILLARKYYDGDQKVYMTDRQEAWLKQHGNTVKFTINHCATVVDALVERLKVTGFTLDDKDLAAQLWTWWTLARLDAMQVEAHRQAVRDGEGFIIVDWNNEQKRPNFILHPRYIDAQVGGDGYGVWMEYPGDNVYASPERAVKRFSDRDEKGNIRERMTVYFPDRIEKFALRGGKWSEFTDESFPAFPMPWILKDGTPIGIPVAHFKNPNLKTELKNVIPPQDALNKVWLDLLAAGDSTAFRMLVTLGFVMTTDGAEPKADGTNLLKLMPGQTISTRKKPGEVDVKSIEPASLDSLLALEERIVRAIAATSDTPMSRFQLSSGKQVAAEGTLKQQESLLLAKVENRQTLFGDGWEDAMRIAIRLANAFGGLSLDAKVGIQTEWRNPAVRDELNDARVAQVHHDVGVPTEALLPGLGYDAKRIEEIKAMPGYGQAQAQSGLFG